MTSILDEALASLAATLSRKPPPVERYTTPTNTIDWSNSDRK